MPAAADEVLSRCYLEVRSRLLDVAAALDRIDRADTDGALGDDARLRQIRDGLRILLEESGNRGEQIQMVFSDEYLPGWNR